MKKIKYLVFALFALFVVSRPVFAATVSGCSSIVDVDSKITNAVHIIIVVIQIVVPVLLVVFGSFDFVKSVIAQKDDEIKKGRQTFLQRLIAAVLVFFIVAIVRLVVSFAAGDGDKQTILDCANCFLNGANADGTCK